MLNHKPCVYEPGTDCPSENSVQQHSSSEISRRKGKAYGLPDHRAGMAGFRISGQLSDYSVDFLFLRHQSDTICLQNTEG